MTPGWVEYCYELLMASLVSIWFNITPTPRRQNFGWGRKGGRLVMLSILQPEHLTNHQPMSFYPFCLLRAQNGKFASLFSLIFESLRKNDCSLISYFFLFFNMPLRKKRNIFQSARILTVCITVNETRYFPMLKSCSEMQKRSEKK